MMKKMMMMMMTSVESVFVTLITLKLTPRIRSPVCFLSSPVGSSSRERRWRRHLTAVLRQLLTGHTKQIITENLYGSTVKLFSSHKRARRLNRHLEMVRTGSGITVRFSIWSHGCIQMRQISHYIDNSLFAIPPK
jgi:hypothetical protein